MRVGIADQDIEYKPSGVFGDGPFSGLEPEDASNAAIARPLVLVLWIDAKHLREVLDVDALAPVSPIKPPHGKTLAEGLWQILRQSPNIFRGHKPHFRHVDTGSFS